MYTDKQESWREHYIILRSHTVHGPLRTRIQIHNDIQCITGTAVRQNIVFNRTSQPTHWTKTIQVWQTLESLVANIHKT
jgi:hypothetical protein